MDNDGASAVDVADKNNQKAVSEWLKTQMSRLWMLLREAYVFVV